MKKTDKKSLAEGCPALVQEEWFWAFNNVLGLNPHRISTSNGKPAFHSLLYLFSQFLICFFNSFFLSIALILQKPCQFVKK